MKRILIVIMLAVLAMLATTAFCQEIDTRDSSTVVIEAITKMRTASIQYEYFKGIKTQWQANNDTVLFEFPDYLLLTPIKFWAGTQYKAKVSALIDSFRVIKGIWKDTIKAYSQ